jgi:Predicted membrane protein involved in D-alanine export
MTAFTGMEFLFRFLPAFLAVYYITPKKFRNTTLLCGSILFYAVGEPYFVLLLAAAVWLNYVFASKVERYRNHHKEKKKSTIWLVIALVIDAGLLTAFKLSGAFLGTGILPLGLSFYTFKMISFQIDVYKGEIKEVPAFQRTAVYFTMFPQLVSGPIMRYNEGIMAANEREYSWEKVEEGLWYFSIGLGTKVLLADRLAILWKDISVIGYESISTPLAWLGAVGYSMELYFDFWGYSLMASGICVMLGMPFILNFDHPYAAKSIGEFWRRWHITLTRFFRDYIYIPLGGSRVGDSRTMRNLLVVWLVTGFWHGGSLNYILWGMVLFVLILVEKMWLWRIFRKVPFLGRCYVLLFIPITWVFFAITDLEQLSIYLGRMFPFAGEGIAVNPGDVVKNLRMYWPYLAGGAVWCVPAVYRFFEKHRKNPVSAVITVLVFWMSVYCLVSMGNNPFAYLKF